VVDHATPATPQQLPPLVHSSSPPTTTPTMACRLHPLSSLSTPLTTLTLLSPIAPAVLSLLQVDPLPRDILYAQRRLYCPHLNSLGTLTPVVHLHLQRRNDTFGTAPLCPPNKHTLPLLLPLCLSYLLLVYIDRNQACMH
jgi:hypothetical protein